MINDREFYMITGKLNTPYTLYFCKFTFGSLFTDWTKQIECFNCRGDLSESLLSSDRTKIFSFFIYGPNPYNMYLSIFNLTDGSLLDSRYKSNSTWGTYNINGSAQKGELIILTVKWDSNSYLVMMDGTLNTFTIKLFSASGTGLNLYGAAYQLNRG